MASNSTTCLDATVQDQCVASAHRSFVSVEDVLVAQTIVAGSEWHEPVGVGLGERQVVLC